MATYDFSQVTASYDKASYVAGEVMRVAVTGDVLRTDVTESTDTVGPITIPVVSASGAQSTITVSQVVVTHSSQNTLPEGVLVDLSRPIVDTGASPRTWTASADQKSVSATA